MSDQVQEVAIEQESFVDELHAQLNQAVEWFLSRW